MKSNFYCPWIYIIVIVSILTSCNSTALKEKNASLSEIPSSVIPDSTKYSIIQATNAPSRISRKVRKDINGNLIIAAFEDIIRYDGNSFSKLPKNIGIESPNAYDAIADRKGNIWIASTKSGLYRYDGESYASYTENNGLLNNRIMSLYEDRVGRIWIGSQGGLSCYFDNSFQNFTTNEGLSDNDINIIFEDNNGKIWIGTRGNLCVFDPSTMPSNTTHSFRTIIDDTGKPFFNIWSIAEDKTGNIWIGGQEGLWRHHGKKYQLVSNESIVCVFKDSSGNIWTTSSQGVLMRYDNTSIKNKKPIPQQIFNAKKMLFGINEDKSGNIWFGGLKGVFKYDGATITYFKNEEHAE